MAKIATLTKNEATGKWEAKYDGKVLCASPDKSYVIGKINGGTCNKANRLGVSAVEEPAGQLTVIGAAAAQVVDDRFSVEERFDFLESFVVGVAKRRYKSLLLTGSGGLGKSFSVNKALRAKGKNGGNLMCAEDQMNSEKMVKPEFRDLDEEDLKDEHFEVVNSVGIASADSMSEEESKKYYTVIKGYSTAKGLYEILYHNRNRIVVFDDCDSILKDPVALMLLKGALDSYERRIISWRAKGFIDDGLPRSFEFTGGVVFISNKSLHEIDQAVRDRTIPVDLSMNTDQKLDRMTQIVKSGEFLPNFDQQIKEQALEFIKKMKDQASEISLRTLIQVTNIVDEGDIGKTKWERRAEYYLTHAA